MEPSNKNQFRLVLLGKEEVYSLEYLQKAHPNFLGLFRRFYQEWTGLQQPQIPEYADRIQTFAVHLFSRGSLLPITSPHDLLDRCPIDYLFEEENHSSYYRGDGSSVVRLILTALRSVFIGVNLENKYQGGLIKPSRFGQAMEKGCVSWDYRYVPVTTLSEIRGEDRTFFDLTPWIQGKASSGSAISQMEWESFSLQIEEKMEGLEESKPLLGGVFEIGPMMGLYVFFSPDSLSDHESLIGEMLNNRGNTGSFPEMIVIKSALARMGLQIHVETSPIEIQALESSIPKIDLNEGAPFLPYARLLNTLLSHVSLDLSKPQDGLVASKLHQSIQKINTEVLPFQLALNEYHFILEQILYLSIFSRPKQEIEDVFAESHPLTEGGRTLMFNSGMTCIDYVIEVVRDRFPKEEKPRLAILEGCYYELKDELKWQLESTWEIKVVNEGSAVKEGTNLLFLDLYPNNVKLKSAKENPVIEIINQALSLRKEGSAPLTAVLDTSTTLMTDPKLTKIRDHFQAAVDQGVLELIIASSLAKFYSCGFDKYTGGVLVYFGKDQECFMKLKALRDQDPMSDEAKTFYSLLVGQAMRDVEFFYQSTLENTEHLYKELSQEKEPGAVLRLHQKDCQVPVLGFGSVGVEEEEARELMKKKENDLSLKALAEGIPLYQRASFPFPHSSVVECDTALRIVAGFDVRRNKEWYKKNVLNG